MLSLVGALPGVLIHQRATNYAINEWNYDAVNPFARRLISDRDRKAARPREWRLLTAHEEKKLLLAADPLTQDIIIFALNTGCRQSEILGLQWFRIEGDTIRFRPEDQKTNRHGIRAMNQAALEAVARQPSGGEYVFHRGDGRRIRRDEFYHEMWDPARRKAGLSDLRFHDLRKNCGQRLLAATGDIIATQYQLGHSDLRTTQKIYTKEPLDRLRGAVAKI